MKTLWTFWLLSWVALAGLLYTSIEATTDRVTVYPLGLLMAAWVAFVLLTHLPWRHPVRRRKDGAA